MGWNKREIRVGDLISWRGFGNIRRRRYAVVTDIRTGQYGSKQYFGTFDEDIEYAKTHIAKDTCIEDSSDTDLQIHQS